MSRIGRKPIKLSIDVTYRMDAGIVMISGPRGSLSQSILPSVAIEQDNNDIRITTLDNSKNVDAYSGLLRTLLSNMIVGVTDGFRRILLIEGVGYKVALNGHMLSFNVGYSTPVEYHLPDGVKASVDGVNKVILESIDRELLGLTAAKIRQIRPPEPYKGKGIRYEDEYIQRKVGKSGGKK